jgi:hypothetical protein
LKLEATKTSCQYPHKLIFQMYATSILFEQEVRKDNQDLDQHLRKLHQQASALTSDLDLTMKSRTLHFDDDEKREETLVDDCTRPSAQLTLSPHLVETEREVYEYDVKDDVKETLTVMSNTRKSSSTVKLDTASTFKSQLEMLNELRNVLNSLKERPNIREP